MLFYSELINNLVVDCHTYVLGNNAFVDLIRLLNAIKYRNIGNWRLPNNNELADILKVQNLQSDFWTIHPYTGAKSVYHFSSQTFTKCATKEDFNHECSLLIVADNNPSSSDLGFIGIGQSATEDFAFIYGSLGVCYWITLSGVVDLFNEHSMFNENTWRVPTIDELERMYNDTPDIFVDLKLPVWSSSENGKYNAFQLNFLTGEKYACKKASDYNSLTGAIILVKDL
jgi:hypothetical protein